MCKIVEDGKETKIKQTLMYKQSSQLHVSVGKVKTGGLGWGSGLHRVPLPLLLFLFTPGYIMLKFTEDS